MIRKLIIVLAAFAIVLGGFSPQGSALLRTAAASDAPTAMSDCASMMEMKGDHENMDCSSTNHDEQENSMKCPADNCTLRCGTVSAQPVVFFVHHRFSTSLPELLPDFPGYVSAAGKPPLRPPRPSILS